MARLGAERRLAAIVAVDVVGYTRLVEIDEAATLSAVKTIYDGVIAGLRAEHHGRAVKFMGDGILFDFASVVDAVSFAVAMQKAVGAAQSETPIDRRLVFRIGVNLGDVVVDGDDLLGDGVNVAARLEQLCPPGGVLVSGTAFDQLRGKVDLTLDFIGEQNVKNIRTPVRTYAVRMAGVRGGRALIFRPLRRFLRPVAVAVVAAVAGIGAWWFWPVSPVRANPSIAVLPFDSFGADATTSRLADGITEDITADLARFRNIDVIARNSTEAYKGKAVDIRQVGRDLNVSYVLEGSIQYEGDRVRVTAQLIDAESESHVWSERWDRPAKDIFAVQSEVSEQVANKLGGALTSGIISGAELQRARRRPPKELTAYDHYLLAAEANGRRTEEAIRNGLASADKAIAIDPTFARAYTVRGWLHFLSIEMLRADFATTIEKVGADFRRAVELDPLDGEAHVSFAVYLSLNPDQMAQSLREVRQALALGPANTHVLLIAAANMPYLGVPEEGVALADRALRLDPHMPPGTRSALCDAYFYGRHYGKVIAIASSMPEESRGSWARLYLAASYALLGRKSEAEVAKASLLTNRGGETSAEQWFNDGLAFAREQERDQFVDAFRALDLPICLSKDKLAKMSAPVRLPECTKL